MSDLIPAKMVEGVLYIPATEYQLSEAKYQALSTEYEVLNTRYNELRTECQVLRASLNDED